MYEGKNAPRRQVREHNLWYRSTSIFVIDEKHRFCVNKRSFRKDYCPGWIDLAFGGLVGAEEMKNIDAAALREAQEEMGLPNIQNLRLPGGAQDLSPKFAFKHIYEDKSTSAWCYIYYVPWHSIFNTTSPIKPQESEIDLVLWLTPE